jgi:trehalose utilization protein
MAEETLEDWKTKKKFDPENIVKSFNGNLKVMKQMMGTLEDLGWDRNDMQIKQWIEDDSEPVESIKTIYSEDKAVDKVEKNGEEVMEIERDR